MNFSKKKTAFKTKVKSKNFLEEVNEFPVAKTMNFPNKQIAVYHSKAEKIKTHDKFFEANFKTDVNVNFSDIFDTKVARSNYKKLFRTLDFHNKT